MLDSYDNIGVDAGFDMLDYEQGHTAYPVQISAKSTEVELWCAVVAQAFLDIGCITSATTPFYNHTVTEYTIDRAQYIAKRKREAAEWLLLNKKDFYFVCSMAGLLPSVIRKAAREFLLKQVAATVSAEADNSASL